MPGAEGEELPVAVVRVLIEIAEAQCDQPRRTIPVFHTAADDDLASVRSIAPCGEDRLVERIGGPVLIPADERRLKSTESCMLIVFVIEHLVPEPDPEIGRKRIGLVGINVRHLRTEVGEVQPGAEAFPDIAEQRDFEG